MNKAKETRVRQGMQEATISKLGAELSFWKFLGEVMMRPVLAKMNGQKIFEAAQKKWTEAALGEMFQHVCEQYPEISEQDRATLKRMMASEISETVETARAIIFPADPNNCDA